MAAIEGFIDEMDRLSRRLMRNLECCDRALVACCDITASQANTLLTLSEIGEMTMHELATEMRLHGTTMTRMVDSLVEKGTAERRHDPEDRRIVRVAINECGREMLQQLQEGKRALLTTAFADLSDQERDTILRGLRQLVRTAEQLGARCCSC